MNGKITGPKTTEEEFFCELLDLNRPELAGIGEAAAKGDYATCEKIFAKAAKENPANKIMLDCHKFSIDKMTREGKINQLVTDRAERVLSYIVEATGVRIQLDKDNIDWQTNPTYNKYREVTYQVVRFGDIGVLAKHFMMTGDKACIKVFTDLVGAFIEKELAPSKDTGPVATMTWRTLDTGGRLTNLSYAMAVFMPYLSDEFITTVYRSLYEHAERLYKAPCMGNWLIFQLHAITDFSFACPFYKAAKRWYDYGVDTLIYELDNQFYPAPVGAQEELAPSYHDGVVRAYLSILDDCFERYGKQPPKELVDKLEKTFNIYPRIVRPDDIIPDLNDSGAFIINTTLRYAYKYYQHHKEYIWFGSFGKEGEQPDFTSTVVENIGWTIFRSSWEKDAVWAFFDSGHYGRGHQHDDKLNFLLTAYGKNLLVEVGNTPYDSSEMRKYAIKSRAHNTIMLNGKEMNDRKYFDDNGLRENYSFTEDSGVRCNFTDEYEVSKCNFDKGWGDDMEKMNAERKVIFVKKAEKYGLKPFFIVIDRFEAPDDAERSYDIMWHLPTECDDVIGDFDVTASYGDGVGLKMLACDEKAKFVNMRGQLTPYYQGWLCTHIGGVKDDEQIPTDTPVFEGTFGGKRRVVTVVYPYGDGECALTGATAGNGFDDTDITVTTTAGEFKLDEKCFE